MRSTITLFVATLLTAVNAAPGLNLKLTGPESVNDVDNLSVKATLVNTGSTTLRLLNNPNSILTPKWNTATFTPTNVATGARPKFNGIKVKWSPTFAALVKDFMTIKPGEMVEYIHDLAGLYNFTTSGAGAYNFASSPTFHVLHDDGSLGTIQATSAFHNAKVEGSLSSKKQLWSAPRSRKRDISFANCTADQATVISEAVKQAVTYAGEADSYINAMVNNGVITATPRYNTWFGQLDSNVFATVQTHFNNINNGQLLTDTYDCYCDPTNDSSVFAYVHPDEFGHIFLCAAFWRASVAGTDSRGGTLIHESSHFTANGGTQDYIYNPDKAMALAATYPAQAAMNADNHEYFAENNPALQ